MDFREMLINFAAKQVGLSKSPSSFEELMSMANANPEFAHGVQKAKQMGIISESPDGRLNVSDQNKAQSFLMSIMKNMM